MATIVADVIASPFLRDAMQLVEVLFFGVIAVSITVSLYLIASFLISVRQQREDWKAIQCSEADSLEETVSLRSVVKYGRRDLSFERHRRMQLSTPEPDLVLVQRGRFAAVVLPLATDTDTYEAIQCRLCLN